MIPREGLWALALGTFAIFVAGALAMLAVKGVMMLLG